MQAGASFYPGPGNPSSSMSASVIINNAIGTILLPPLNLILLCACGILLSRRWPRFGTALGLLALLALAVISTQVGALMFVAPLEARTRPLEPGMAGTAQAIVVLGGGRLANAPEYGGTEIPGYLELARLRYAARLQRETGLPVLTSGGRPDGAGEPEADSMARSLREDFGVPVAWREGRSNNTAQNAAFAAAILGRQGIRRILLVTDAMHMPRAQAIFAATGLQVVAAPTVFFSRDRLDFLQFLPDGEGLRRSHYALHEWLGLAWYALRYRHGP